MRIILTHLYVIIMATIVITAGNIIADQYGGTIKHGISTLLNSVDREVTEVQHGVTDWNKKILD